LDIEMDLAVSIRPALSMLFELGYEWLLPKHFHDNVCFSITK